MIIVQLKNCGFKQIHLHGKKEQLHIFFQLVFIVDICLLFISDYFSMNYFADQDTQS